MGDHFIEQAVITLNLLRQSLFYPHLSTWAHHNKTLNYDATPMGPMGFRVLIHEPVKTRTSWGFHAMPVHYVGSALHHYRCFTVFPIKTRSIKHSETVEHRNDFITLPIVTPKDKVVSEISKLKQEMAIIPSPISNNKLTATKQLQTMFSKYKGNEPSTTIDVDKNNATPHQHYDVVELNQQSMLKRNLQRNLRR